MHHEPWRLVPDGGMILDHGDRPPHYRVWTVPTPMASEYFQAEIYETLV